MPAHIRKLAAAAAIASFLILSFPAHPWAGGNDDPGVVTNGNKKDSIGLPPGPPIVPPGKVSKKAAAESLAKSLARNLLSMLFRHPVV